jgi:hypothetical protein
MDRRGLSLDAEGDAVTRPTADTPIPAPVRPIVERVHRRCRAVAIDDPRNVPLTALERVALAQWGYYPIAPAVIRLGMTPTEHHRQQILDAVAEQLPYAVKAMLETMEV